jgi:hypothetical protein
MYTSNCVYQPTTSDVANPKKIILKACQPRHEGQRDRRGKSRERRQRPGGGAGATGGGKLQGKSGAYCAYQQTRQDFCLCPIGPGGGMVPWELMLCCRAQRNSSSFEWEHRSACMGRNASPVSSIRFWTFRFSAVVFLFGAYELG